MIEISTTNEINELLFRKETANIKLPANASLFLDDTSLNRDAQIELEEVAKRYRRSLHCY